jgi:hypothetical protein
MITLKRTKFGWIAFLSNGVFGFAPHALGHFARGVALARAFQRTAQ